MVYCIFRMKHDEDVKQANYALYGGSSLRSRCQPTKSGDMNTGYVTGSLAKTEAGLKSREGCEYQRPPPVPMAAHPHHCHTGELLDSSNDCDFPPPPPYADSNVTYVDGSIADTLSRTHSNDHVYEIPK